MEDEVGLVQFKINLLEKVLSIVSGDPSYEEVLNEVSNEIKDAKSGGIRLPEDLEMMLEAKIQIVNELKSEFYATLDRCADSFSKQLVQDLRKILFKATKDH